MPQAIVPRRFNSDNTRSNFSKIFFSLESYIHSLSFDKASGKGQELHKLVLSDHSIAGSFTTNEGRTRLRLTADKIIKKTIWKSVGWSSKQQFASSTKGESDFLQRFVIDGFQMIWLCRASATVVPAAMCKQVVHNFARIESKPAAL